MNEQLEACRVAFPGLIWEPYGRDGMIGASSRFQVLVFDRSGSPRWLVKVKDDGDTIVLAERDALPDALCAARAALVTLRRQIGDALGDDKTPG